MKYWGQHFLTYAYVRQYMYTFRTILNRHTELAFYCVQYGVIATSVQVIGMRRWTFNISRDEISGNGSSLFSPLTDCVWSNSALCMHTSLRLNKSSFAHIIIHVHSLGLNVEFGRSNDRYFIFLHVQRTQCFV